MFPRNHRCRAVAKPGGVKDYLEPTRERSRQANRTERGMVLD